MPRKNREEYLQYQKEYRQKNKEKSKEYQKEYSKKNKDKANERAKDWYKQNRERVLNNHQSDAGKKIRRINNWKKIGVIHENYDELYEIFLNTKNCELCNVELTIDYPSTKTTRCLDHDHETGLFRNILCNSCNVKRG